jgi:hypothetical protein
VGEGYQERGRRLAEAERSKLAEQQLFPARVGFSHRRCPHRQIARATKTNSSLASLPILGPSGLDANPGLRWGSADHSLTSTSTPDVQDNSMLAQVGTRWSQRPRQMSVAAAR